MALLRQAGHDVETYIRTNDELAEIGPLGAAASAIWSKRTYADVRSLIESFRPNIVHCHNTFPLVSPSVYYAANAAGVPVIQTLHNFRTVCLNALLHRDDKPCTDCVGKTPWRGVVRRCYQGGLPQSAVSGSLLVAHRLLQTYQTRVSGYIALSQFAREVFVRAGLPDDRIHVKPNFVEVPHDRTQLKRSGVLFVGRLSEEKGVRTLARVARRLPQVRFIVVGDGPLSGLLSEIPNVDARGRLSRDAVFALMRRAQCLIVPSSCFEGFPMVIAEAFANGLPAVVSSIGSLTEIVNHNVTGLHCEPGNVESYADAIARCTSEPALIEAMSRASRDYSARELSPERNISILESIYTDCMLHSRTGRSHVRLS